MQTGQVFISHTSDMARYPAGRSFVQAVLDAVSRAGLAPVDMQYFPAREGQPADYCRRRVRECEIYVAVVGFCYGSIVPGETVSYTQLEFREATAAGRPRLVFLLEDGIDPPAWLADADRSAVAGFRQRPRDAGLLVRSFTTGEGLELEVFHALTSRVWRGGQVVVPRQLPAASARAGSRPSRRPPGRSSPGARGCRWRRDLGERYNEADVLAHLGDAHHADGDLAAAREAWQQALAILDDLYHPDAAQVRAKLAALTTPAAKAPG